MKLVDRCAGEAIGAILAHSQRTEAGVVRKGTRIGPQEAAILAGAGPVTVALLEAGDVGEDDAARALAAAAAGALVTPERADTGRCNLLAEADGLFVVDAGAVHALNRIDPAVTLATLMPFERVSRGQMVGTVKIIPFAVPGSVLSKATGTLAAPILSVAPWQPLAVQAISTRLPVLKESVLDKTLRVLEQRLGGTAATLASDRRVPHETDALARALREATGDLVIVFGASAVMDRDDVIPAAIRAAGGTVDHLGMPVDPGNLLVLGSLGERRVIGAPGCARSPKRNGFDFVLDRLLARLPVGAQDIVAMGVGGLLTDTPARPRPRRGVASSAVDSPAAIVLAAGRSTRMGERNKLLEEVEGRPMIRATVEAALASRADPVVVVTGHEADRVRAALAGLNLIVAHNSAFADGLSTSLRAGIAALPASADAALILLGDMPLVSAHDCDCVLDALAAPDVLVAMATAGGKRGNPVAWSAGLFAELSATEGDAGGRALLSRYADHVAEVELGRAAALDADTPQALEAVRAAAVRAD